MPKCPVCGKPVEAKRSTKRYCSDRCRYAAWRGSSTISLQEIVDVLNWHWQNGREVLAQAKPLAFLNLAVQRVGQVEWDGEQFSVA
jgi:hypothetical protein